MRRELGRFASSDGSSLIRLATRLSAVDARDGRETAATADVDPIYRMRDQLFVQPDARLEECFGMDEPIRMTRQEIAVARSHIEAWKTIAAGEHDDVLILEDDVWFTVGAAKLIERGWLAALERQREDARLLYLSYKDAGGTAERVDACGDLFRPVRGLWYMSGYVLSRAAAATLLRAMPVVGPVDLWMNHRFAALDVAALSSPAILQREDGGSDNAYSILPYLARAGTVDAGSAPMAPTTAAIGPVFAWTARDRTGSMAMALSMLGLRVRVSPDDEDPAHAQALLARSRTFDAFVNASLTPDALAFAIEVPGSKFVVEAAEALPSPRPPRARTLVLRDDGSERDPWRQLCALFGVRPPDAGYPLDVPGEWRMFEDARPCVTEPAPAQARSDPAFSELDESPWVLPPAAGWSPRLASAPIEADPREPLVQASMRSPPPEFAVLVETFPGNLASFDQGGVVFGEEGASLSLRASSGGVRPFRSGAFASVRPFGHGRFEAEIRAAPGAGLVTGFFLHRDSPRQEIDVELMGGDPRSMLVNVYFNPGDDGAAIEYGYRGSPCRVDLGFDATSDFHLYSIDWSPRRIRWSVDGRTIHERSSWDPTPIPHLPMRLYANLWAPRSEALAGNLQNASLPSEATFRDVFVHGD